MAELNHAACDNFIMQSACSQSSMLGHIAQSDILGVSKRQRLDILPAVCLSCPANLFLGTACDNCCIQLQNSEIRWASRWDTYLLMMDDQIHWFSIINSLMIVLFLSGMVAMIMMRTLHRDISKYNQLDSAEEAQEETGWKLVSLQKSSSAACCIAPPCLGTSFWADEKGSQQPQVVSGETRRKSLCVLTLHDSIAALRPFCRKEEVYGSVDLSKSMLKEV